MSGAASASNSAMGKGLPELFHHSVQLAWTSAGELLVDGAYHGGHARLGTLGPEQVGHEVSAAALPAGSSKDRGDGVLQPLVGIGGYHPPRCRQRPQEGQTGAHVP